MNKPKPKQCPLLSKAPVEFNADCMADRCAGFHMEYHEDGDYTEGTCALVRIADRLANSQTFGILEKKRPPQRAAGRRPTNDLQEQSLALPGPDLHHAAGRSSGGVG